MNISTQDMLTGIGEDSRLNNTEESKNDEERSSNGEAIFHDESILKPKPGKKTRGRVKIKFEYIKSKDRRFTTFSKRKTGLMKKAYELSALTGTQVMLLVASETGHVYTFATRKLMPIVTSSQGKSLIQTCLSTPDDCEGTVPASLDDSLGSISECIEKRDSNGGSAQKKAKLNSKQRDSQIENDGQPTSTSSERGDNNGALTLTSATKSVTQGSVTQGQSPVAVIQGQSTTLAENVQYLYTAVGNQSDNVFTFVNAPSQPSYFMAAPPLTSTSAPTPLLFPSTISLTNEQGNSNAIHRTIYIVPCNNYTDAQNASTNGLTIRPS